MVAPLRIVAASWQHRRGVQVLQLVDVSELEDVMEGTKKRRRRVRMLIDADLSSWESSVYAEVPSAVGSEL